MTLILATAIFENRLEVLDCFSLSLFMISSPADSPAPTGPMPKTMRSLGGKQTLASPQPVQEPTVPKELPEASEAVGGVNTVCASETSPGDSTKAEKLRLLDRLKQPAKIRKGAKNTPEAAVGRIGNVSGDGDNEPTTLAERIRSMINALPTSTLSNFRTFPKPMPPARDADGCPIPPPEAIPIKDKKLIAKLYNPNVMNAEGSESGSVWSILESLRATSHDGDDNSSTWSDDSIMMYSPLFPTEESLVEIAASHIVPAPRESAPLQPKALWQRKWPWWKKLASADGNADKEKNGDDNKTAVPPTPTRVWIPSTTKISVQVMWWGYRLYLPPPVLTILSQGQLETTKRAATITAALTWLFTHIPISLLPPPIQPALLLLQKVVPYLGYIGSFISWSWSTIKGYDIGYGVILSATWLLPVALLPGTWQEADFPKSMPTTPSTGAPSTSTPSPPSTGAPTTTNAPPPTTLSVNLPPPTIPAPAAPGFPAVGLLGAGASFIEDAVSVPPDKGNVSEGDVAREAKKGAWWRVSLPF
ncbi:uncharacterized protein BT62DRAFT_752856 [Guyanagaster necrorhizus]|uniref:Uncharacterized protein n=1 Tax=Guyanagaster necrorhizus TaxID=856835 RepID=A0A9P7VW75_9AGAR|nr:uncharacterized protein BT62DRAFT_752856 [Guyanagaster necrorhizus MCA 3950]KAG7448089.1 hypothetical protein BT62DRAFT_752856 [Guyanagaster necrorhizus MCA 3950]